MLDAGLSSVVDDDILKYSMCREKII